MMRYWHALRRQSLVQIARRVRHVVSIRAYARASWLGSFLLADTSDLRRSTSFQYPLATSTIRGGWLAPREFEFLGERRTFKDQMDWDPAGASLLWRFHLHYFDWAPRLRTAFSARSSGGGLDRQEPARTSTGLAPLPHLAAYRELDARRSVRRSSGAIASEASRVCRREPRISPGRKPSHRKCLRFARRRSLLQRPSCPILARLRLEASRRTAEQPKPR